MGKKKRWKAKVTKKEVKFYSGYYPELTKTSVRKGLQVIRTKMKDEATPLSPITVDYHLRARRFGGLGYGRKRKR